MKKVLLVFICFILVFAGTFAADAYISIDSGMKDILKRSLEEQMPEKYMEILHNAELYYGNNIPNNPNYMDNPILDLNCQMSVSSSGPKPFEVLLDESMNARVKSEVIVLGNVVRCVTIARNGERVIFRETYKEEALPSFVADILKLKKNVVLGGQECVLNRILCIDNSTSRFGTAVFLQTDKGVFVRYYPLPDSECMEMTQQVYAAYCYAWDDYIKSSPSNSGGANFTGFVMSNSYSDVKDYTPPLETLNPKPTTGPEEKPSLTVPDEKSAQPSWLIPAGIAVVCVAGAGLAVLLWKKKKA